MVETIELKTTHQQELIDITQDVKALVKGIDSGICLVYTTHTTIGDYALITAFYVDYRHRKKIIQLILSREGRISTKNNLSHIELVDIYIYYDISKTLLMNST